MDSKEKEYRKVKDFLRSHVEYTIGDRLAEIAEKKPEFTAFIYQDKQVSYREFDELANRFAWFFVSKGIRKGDVVALFLKNSPYYLAMVIGLSRIGAIAALINTELKGEKLAEDISMAEAKMVVVDENLLPKWEGAKDFVRLRYPGEIVYYPCLLEGLPADVQKPSCTVSRNFEPFVYLYSAGATGGRRVVPLTHYRWLLTAEAVRIYAELTEEDRGYTCIPFWLNSGFSGAFAAMLASGSTLVLVEEFSASRFWENVSNSGATYFLGTGQMFRYLWQVEPNQFEKNHRVRKILSNGMPGDLFVPVKERYNVSHIVEIYGTTENVGILINIDEIPGMCGSLNWGGEREGEVARYDEEKDEIIYGEDGYAFKCCAGESGVLLLKVDEYEGFEGYINNFAESEFRLLKGVFEEGDCYFNTRDLVKLHSNDYVEFVRRLDDIYRWRGKTVSAAMVRDVIRKFFGPVEDAYVFGVSVKGYEGRAGMAVVKLLEGEKLDWNKFTDYLQRRLSRAEMPAFIRLTYTKKRLKDNKIKYIEEGFDPEMVKEELFVYSGERKGYIPLTAELYQDILNHKFWL